jgi:hypothetical protein
MHWDNLTNIARLTGLEILTNEVTNARPSNVRKCLTRARQPLRQIPDM